MGVTTDISVHVAGFRRVSPRRTLCRFVTLDGLSRLDRLFI